MAFEEVVGISPLFWGNRKLLNKLDSGVSAALRHNSIAGQPQIARGVYSLLFAGTAESVFKLTLDAVSYELAEHQSAWRCPGLPGVLALHGEVGRTESGVSLWLLELEKLERLPRGSRQRKECLRFGRLLRKNEDLWGKPAEQLGYLEARATDPVLKEALRQLIEFAVPRATRARLDMHGSNFMFRASTQQSVISDPFMDHEVRDRILSQHRYKVFRPDPVSAPGSASVAARGAIGADPVS